MKKLLLLVFVLLLLLPVFAQKDEVRFIRADIYKGLSHNQVNAIYRDEKGFVWLGTMSGLNRYDGYNFKIFRNQPTDTTSINDNYIDRIFPYPGDRMLVKTRNGLNIYNPFTEQFNRDYEVQQRHLNLPDTIVDKVITDSKGNYWFVFNSKGLWQYKANGSAVSYNNITKS